MDHEFCGAGNEGHCEATQPSCCRAPDSPRPLQNANCPCVGHNTDGLNKSKPDNYVLRQKLNTSDVGLYLKRLTSLTLVVCVSYWKLKHPMLPPPR